MNKIENYKKFIEKIKTQIVRPGSVKDENAKAEKYSDQKLWEIDDIVKKLLNCCEE